MLWGKERKENLKAARKIRVLIWTHHHTLRCSSSQLGFTYYLYLNPCTLHWILVSFHYHISYPCKVWNAPLSTDKGSTAVKSNDLEENFWIILAGSLYLNFKKTGKPFLVNNFHLCFNLLHDLGKPECSHP